MNTESNEVSNWQSQWMALCKEMDKNAKVHYVDPVATTPYKTEIRGLDTSDSTVFTERLNLLGVVERAFYRIRVLEQRIKALEQQIEALEG
ncbi:MAG: hypothetical protein AAF806_12445 [Bacteroidota bacterium]